MDRRVQRVIQMIEEDIRANFALAELARAVNLSPSYLCHLFKSETGMAPTHYVKVLRMTKAKELLETTFMSVKEIATRIGAHDGSHFVRDFKRQYKVTPTQYRRSMGSNGSPARIGAD
jgi:transcriptional regulator GlxA family with amidase domain